MALLVYVLFSTKLMQNSICFISISLGFMNPYSFQLEYHQRLSYNFCLLFFVCVFLPLVAQQSFVDYYPRVLLKGGERNGLGRREKRAKKIGRREKGNKEKWEMGELA